MTEIGASILSADFTKIAQEISDLENAGVDFLHMDIMDGSFVENISFGNYFVHQIREITKLPFDIHLMVQEPEKFISKFPGEKFTFHFESPIKIETLELMNRIHPKKICIAINPKTPVESVYDFLDQLDSVLIMGVKPGLGGQKFIESTIEKVLGLRKEIDSRNLKTKISIDGGVNDETSRKLVAAGADTLIVGSYLINQKDRKSVITNLKKLKK